MRTREAISILGGLAALAALPVTVGCTPLVGAQLSDKPAYGTGGGGAGGSDGQGSADRRDDDRREQRDGREQPREQRNERGRIEQLEPGGPTCPMWFADCDGMGASACKTNLRMDPMNCGACMVKCMMPGLCINGKCK